MVSQSMALSAQGDAIFVAAASAALRAIRKIASVKLVACWSVSWMVGSGGSGGKSAGGASCGGGGVQWGENAGGGAGQGGVDGT